MKKESIRFAETGDQTMARPRKPIPVPPRRNPFKAWGNIPTDNRAERKRLARIVATNERTLVNYRRFCRELGKLCRTAHWQLFEKARSDPKLTRSLLLDLKSKVQSAFSALANIGPDALAALDVESDDFPDGHEKHPEVSRSAKLEDYLVDRVPYDPGIAERANEEQEAAEEAARNRLSDPETHEERLRQIDETLDESDRTILDNLSHQSLPELAQLIDVALSKLPTPHAGRPPDLIAREMVQGLADLWHRQTGEKATVGTFLETDADHDSYQQRSEFVSFSIEVITPIWTKRGFPIPSVKDFAKVVLYPGTPRPKT